MTAKTLIQVKNVQKDFGDRTLLKNVSFDIKHGDKIGLVGWNGAGKTTLIKLLLGQLQVDNGSVMKKDSSLTIGYLPQHIETDISVHPALEDADQKTYSQLFQATSQIGLHHLNQWEQHSLNHLSGGERMKLCLSNLWATSPTMIILDEPTNHLDMQGIQWLIRELNQYEGAAIIISHDRYFLDQTVNITLEIEDGTLTQFEGNYTAYQAEKSRQREQQAKEYDKQQRKIKTIHQQVATLKQWSEKAHRTAGKGGSKSENRQMGLKEYERVKAKKKDNQVKSKLKRLELELAKHKIEKPKDDYSVHFNFECTGKRGKRVVEANHLSKQFGKRTLFEESHFYLLHGEKVALIGPNGSGKTTFIQMLLNQETISGGILWKSDSLRIAYLNQDASDLPLQKTVLDYLNVTNREQLTYARTLLANMGLNHQKVIKPLAMLSDGEKMKVKMVYMILQQNDILILDEPTNHLDLPSREQLENTLLDYDGTLIIVSHDRYLINKLCHKLLVINNKRIERYDMNLLEYEQKYANQRKMNDTKLNDTRSIPKNSSNQQALLKELPIIETKITELLGKIQNYLPESDEYKAIDDELICLIKKKKQIKGLI